MQLRASRRRCEGVPGRARSATPPACIGWPQARRRLGAPGPDALRLPRRCRRPAPALGLQPAMRLESRLIAVREYRGRREHRLRPALDAMPERDADCRCGGRLCRRHPSRVCRSGTAGAGPRSPRLPGRPRVDGHDHARPARRPRRRQVGDAGAALGSRACRPKKWRRRPAPSPTNCSAA